MTEMRSCISWLRRGVAYEVVAINVESIGKKNSTPSFLLSARVSCANV